jgi:hypothetical protein
LGGVPDHYHHALLGEEDVVRARRRLSVTRRESCGPGPATQRASIDHRGENVTPRRSDPVHRGDQSRSRFVLVIEHINACRPMRGRPGAQRQAGGAGGLLAIAGRHDPVARFADRAAPAATLAGLTGRDMASIRAKMQASGQGAK